MENTEKQLYKEDFTEYLLCLALDVGEGMLRNGGEIGRVEDTIERICRAETQFVFDFLKPYIHTFPACLVWIFVACVFGCVIILLLKKIPIINKFI